MLASDHESIPSAVVSTHAREAAIYYSGLEAMLKRAQIAVNEFKANVEERYVDSETEGEVQDDAMMAGREAYASGFASQALSSIEDQNRTVSR